MYKAIKSREEQIALVGKEEDEQDQIYFEQVRRKIYGIVECKISVTTSSHSQHPVSIVYMDYDMYLKTFTNKYLHPDEQTWNNTRTAVNEIYHLALKKGSVIKIIHEKTRYYVVSKWGFNHLRRIPQKNAYNKVYQRTQKKDRRFYKPL